MAKHEDLIRVGSQGLQMGAFHLTAVGMSVKGEPSFEEWEKCGAFLQRIEGAVQWWLGDWLNYGESSYGEKYSQALEVTGIPLATLENYAYVAGNLQDSRRREDLSFSVHSEIVGLQTAKEQDRWLAKAADEGWTRAELRSQLRLAKRQAHHASGDLPRGKFRVIYADPPWAYNDSGVVVSSDAYGRAERHYPTMTIDELCALPIADRVEDDAVLFLWVTSPLLSACWPVIEAWGFTYKTSIVWDKVAHNFGHYVSVRHEFLLICTRGSCTPDNPTPMPDSVVSERRSDEHSEKPESFRQLVEQLYPIGRRLELFGRASTAGWTVYGNQLSDDDLSATA
jgi:N6-adenosine-specific RNA methylase IME4|tara:strand:- start:3852 stop:4868 length:1017 start_codon:yes stop_codon:yes gene_type:complete